MVCELIAYVLCAELSFDHRVRQSTAAAVRYHTTTHRSAQWKPTAATSFLVAGHVCLPPIHNRTKNCSRSYIPPLASTLLLPSVMSRLHTHQRRPRAHPVTYTLAILLITLSVIICVCPVAVGAQYNTQEYESSVSAYERSKQLYGNIIGIGSSIR
jgi:hypothetical protein